MVFLFAFNNIYYINNYKVIKKYETIVIARHISVDPDAMASQIALRDSIKLTFPSKKVYAIDIDEKKIEICKNNCKIYECENNIEFILGDYLQMKDKIKVIYNIN